MRNRPHVALIIETSKQYGRSLIAGITQYVKAHGPWSVFIEERGIEDPVPRWLRHWDGDGIIARVNDDEMARSLLAMRVPLVNVRQYHTTVPMPEVFEDDQHLCRLAVSHFAEHRFGAFAFCGWPHIPWSVQRGVNFAKSVREAEMGECYCYSPRKPGGRMPPAWEQEQEEVAAWLTSLPKPVAILAANDVRGLQILDACRRINLPVPEQCAVLGVDNEQILCDLADPPLSSIDQDEERIGFEAAALLDRLMRGEARTEGEGPLYIKPLGVVTRTSTDSVAVDDADVAKALRFIRMHACDRISIDDVATHACLSRRVLQRRFKELLGKSPLEEILSVQLGRVQQLLAGTDLKLHAVAERTGFAYVGHMSSFFKARTGITPGEFRRRAQGATAARAGRPVQEMAVRP
jgi:LacI family transcriptional regulator